MSENCAHCEGILSALDDATVGFVQTEWELPRGPGVYAVEVLERGGDSARAVCEYFSNGLQPLVTAWPLVGEHFCQRLQRLRRISGCHLIYIGRTSSLRARYKDFRGRHTVQVPLCALAYSGWRLGLRAKTVNSADAALEAEHRLLEEFRANHGCYPALNSGG